jgi:hypothetical protein
MCVQPSAVERKVIQHIVLYCLTPPRFRRYSSFNLCPPSPAWDGMVEACIVFYWGGIRLVNRGGQARIRREVLNRPTSRAKRRARNGAPGGG